MKTTIEIARRGQITIPKILREELGIEEGQKYELRSLEGGVMVLTPRNGQASAALKQLRQMLEQKGASLDEMLIELRREREMNEK